jgi:putative endonuclease
MRQAMKKTQQDFTEWRLLARQQTKHNKMPFFVYILRTSSDTLYIGYTTNLEKRLKEHQSGGKKAAKYTRYFSSLELVYSEKYTTKSEALKREAALKKLTRPQKESLIASSSMSPN